MVAVVKKAKTSDARIQNREIRNDHGKLAVASRGFFSILYSQF
jgi:hypothetical protein